MLRTSNKLNAGSFLVKSNEWSLKFLDGTRSMYDEKEAKEKEAKGEHTPHDQQAMVQLMEAKPALLGNVKYIPQWKMNAYPEEIGCYDEDKRDPFCRRLGSRKGRRSNGISDEEIRKEN
jgi:mannan polymerase II complex MNN10 subunit